MAALCRVATVATRSSSNPPTLSFQRRLASTWYQNPTTLATGKKESTTTSGTWYNPTPAPARSTYKPTKQIRRETSTNPPRTEHCPGFYSFFSDLETGFKDIPWPSKEETKFHPDFMNGFKIIPNYISQEEHDRFLREVLDYAHESHKVTHFDGRIVLNDMDTDFYPLYFEKLRRDGIVDKSERFPPNIYGPGDGIPAHFDSILDSQLTLQLIFKSKDIVHVKGTVCSIGLGAPDVIKFVNMPTGSK